jgi:hypothetical protein
MISSHYSNPIPLKCRFFQGKFIALFLFLITLIALCISPESIANRDIIVEKVNGTGFEEWQVKVDSGYDDYSQFLIDSPQGEYVVGGTYMYNDARGGCPKERPCDYAIEYPRIIWINQNGIVNNDIIYSSAQFNEKAISFFQTGNREYFIASSGMILIIGENKNPVFHKTFDFKNYGSLDIYSVIESSDNNYILVGNRALHNEIPAPAWIGSIDTDGEFSWEYYFPNTSTFRKVAEAEDRAYLIADDDNRLYLMDSSGHLVWNRSGLGEIRAMRPSGDGYQILVPGRSYDLNKDGNITRSVSFKIIDPVIRTKDGGFAAVSIEGENIALTRFDQNGKVLWQQGNPNQYRAKPVSLIETSDGGFAILLIVNNKTPGT